MHADDDDDHDCYYVASMTTRKHGTCLGRCLQMLLINSKGVFADKMVILGRCLHMLLIKSTEHVSMADTIHMFYMLIFLEGVTSSEMDILGRCLHMLLIKSRAADSMWTWQR